MPFCCHQTRASLRRSAICLTWVRPFGEWIGVPALRQQVHFPQFLLFQPLFFPSHLSAHPLRAEEQYLTLGGYGETMQEHRPIGDKQTTELCGAIQIWRVDCSTTHDPHSKRATLDTVICHEYGCV